MHASTAEFHCQPEPSRHSFAAVAAQTPQAFSLDDLDHDPDYNPALLPPPTRADVVQERPAGGTPEEVAAANPGLAAAVPATVGQSGPTPADTAAEVAEHNLQGAGTATGTAAGAAGTAGEPAVAGAGLSLGDGSGMDVPELAVLPTEGI
jgi:hypothetical protein